ncbi:hypothetical protein D3C73_736950 [compost metagenome]
MVVGLHGLDLPQGFGNITADIGNPVLAQAREVTHPATENQDRRDHQGQGHHYDTGELGVGDEQQDDPADHHQQIAQEQRQRRPDDRLQQRSVGGQARLDFGAAIVFVKTRVQVNQVIEHVTPDIGDAALADPRHQVKPYKGADRQPHHQQHEQANGLIEQVWRLGHEPLVHQQADALPHGQGDAGSDDQRQQGAKGLPAIRRNEATGQANGTAVTGREHRNHPGQGSH